MTKLLMRLFVKKGKDERQSVGTLGSAVGIACNFLLFAIKLAVGFAASSISVIADGLNNLSDMGSSVITAIGFKLSAKPADKEHPFGHGRMEYISAFTVSFFILTVGAELFINSVKRLISGAKTPVCPFILFAVLTVSVLLKLWMYFFNRKLSKKIDSAALLATAKDSLNDCFTTSAVLLSALVLKAFPNIPFDLDAVIAVGVSAFIIKSGISSLKDTLGEILGTPPSAEEIKNIENEIMKFDGFLGIHDLMVHNYGHGREFASVHVEVPQNVNLAECHEKVDLCEKVVSGKTGVNLVIHIDPVDTDDENVAKAKEEISDIVKTIDRKLSIHDFRMTPAGTLSTNLIFDIVVPNDFKLKPEELKKAVSFEAKKINPSYNCIITIDHDFTGEL